MEKSNSNNQYQQYLAASVVLLFGTVLGLCIGWPSPAILLLTSNHSPLPTGKISIDESTWLTSLKSIGSLIAFPIFGFVANKFGRKLPIIFLSIPAAFSWMLILVASNIYYIYAARFLHGFILAGIFTLCQLYFVEISHDRIRGALGTIVSVGADLGTLLGFAFGTYCDYEVTPIAAIILTLASAILFSFFPETPTYLVKQNELLKAEKSIRFYQNIKRDTDDGDKIVRNEIDKLKHQIADNKMDGFSVNRMKLTDLTTNPGRKAMIIGIVLAMANHFSGSFAIISYAAEIFEETGSIFSENQSALIIAAIQLCGTCTLPFLIERIGRKALYIISTSGTTCGFSTLATYLLFRSWHYDVTAFSWISIVSLSLVVFSQTIGLSTLLYTFTAELLPENLREFGISCCSIVLSISSFIVLKFMPYMCEILGMYGMMYWFAGICIPTMLFIIFYVPETKGKSYDEIMESLQQSKPKTKLANCECRK